MTDSTLKDRTTAPIVGTFIDGKVIWKTDELRAKYETPNKPIVQSAQSKPVLFYETVGDVATTPDYWDCECERDYIHHKSVPTCKDCGANREDQPDSRFEEVWVVLNSAKEE